LFVHWYLFDYGIKITNIRFFSLLCWIRTRFYRK
jgi:hypothetical protein